MPAVGRLVARIIGRDETGPAASSAKRNVGGVTDALNTAKLAAAGFAAGAVNGMIEFGQRALQTTREVAELSNSLQISTEEASRLSFASRRAGVDLNDLRGLLERLNEIVFVDSAESDTVANALRAIGIDPDDTSLQDKTITELAAFYADVFQQAGREGAARAAELGLPAQDLTALVQVAAQFDTPGGFDVDLRDLITEQQVREFQNDLAEKGLSFGAVLARSIDHLRQDVSTFRDLASVLTLGIVDSTDEVAERAAQAFVERYGERTGEITAQQQLTLYNAILPTYQTVFKQLGEASANAYAGELAVALDNRLGGATTGSDEFSFLGNLFGLGQDRAAAQRAAGAGAGIPNPAEQRTVFGATYAQRTGEYPDITVRLSDDDREALASRDRRLSLNPAERLALAKELGTETEAALVRWYERAFEGSVPVRPVSGGGVAPTEDGRLGIPGGF